MKFVSVDTIFAKLFSELRGTELNETDIIGWIGEAMSFLDAPEALEEVVAFLKVKNHEACVPDNFHMAIQLARYEKDICINEEKISEKEEEEIKDLSCMEQECAVGGVREIVEYMLGTLDTSYRPYFDMQWQYIPWSSSAYNKESFSPIRLSNHSFFNSIVCEEEKSLYDNCEDEYTIVGTIDKKFRFSFKEGYVALSYRRNAIDPKTGYPLVPDNIRHITAVNYYVRWKMAESRAWNGREGFSKIAGEQMELWLKYVKQANNYSMLPKGVDDYQDLLEQSHQLIPKQNRYYGFFGKLGKRGDMRFNGHRTNTKNY